MTLYCNGWGHTNAILCVAYILMEVKRYGGRLAGDPKHKVCANRARALPGSHIPNRALARPCLTRLLKTQPVSAGSGRSCAACHCCEDLPRPILIAAFGMVACGDILTVGNGHR